MTPMPPEPEYRQRIRAFKHYYDRGILTVASDEGLDAMALIADYDALRERIVDLAKYAAHHGGCAEYQCVDGSDCVCGLTDLMDTLKREGLT